MLREGTWGYVYAYAWDIEMAHFFNHKTLRWLQVRSNQYLDMNFFSNFESSQSF